MSISEMKAIRIGSVNGRTVYYNRIDQTVKLSGTNIMIIGAKTVYDAIKIAEKTFHNFQKIV